MNKLKYAFFSIKAERLCETAEQCTDQLEKNLYFAKAAFYRIKANSYNSSSSRQNDRSSTFNDFA